MRNQKVGEKQLHYSFHLGSNGMFFMEHVHFGASINS